MSEDWDFLKPGLCEQTPTAEPKWGSSPVERDDLYLSRGLHEHCEESLSFTNKGQDEYFRIKEEHSASSYVKDGIEIQYFKGHTPQPELDELASLMRELNQLFPRSKINFVDHTSAGNGYMSGCNRSGGVGCVNLSDIKGDKKAVFKSYVHEFGHGVYKYLSNHKKGSEADLKDLRQLLLAAWFQRNYLIVKDSSYVHPDHTFSQSGHTNSDDELFASTMSAYYQAADQFAAFIQSPKTPPAMRSFGAAMWSFMRDRVFRGRVFTQDGQDPFPEASHKQYIANLDFDPESVVKDRFFDCDTNLLETYIMMSYVNIPKAIQDLDHYLYLITSSESKSGIREFMFECIVKEQELFLERAEALLDTDLDEETRLELIGLIGYVSGANEVMAIELLDNELYGGTPQTRSFAARVIKGYIDGNRQSKAIGQDYFLTDQFVQLYSERLEGFDPNLMPPIRPPSSCLCNAVGQTGHSQASDRSLLSLLMMLVFD